MHFVSIYTWTLLKTALNDSEDADHKQSIPQLQENRLFFFSKKAIYSGFILFLQRHFFPVKPAALHKFVFSSPKKKKNQRLKTPKPVETCERTRTILPLQTNSVIMSMHVQTDSFENIASPPKKHIKIIMMNTLKYKENIKVYLLQLLL